jgi:AcrR family transcriptional regulator
MSATEPRPLRADARRNRERILDAARELFAENGQATQMDDIARRACVGVGTVYRHFPTKDVLLGELMATKFRNHIEVARRWAEQEDDGWAAFEGFLRESWATMARDAAQQRMMWTVPASALEYADAARAELSAVIGEMIARAQKAGTMTTTFTVDDMPALMCAVGSVMSADVRPVQSWQPVAELLLAGLRAR